MSANDPYQTVEVAETFRGPMDLLLYLIKRDEVDIHDIPISRITSEFIRMIDAMPDIDVDQAAEFVNMASMLMEIKSRMLLPPEEVAAEEEIVELDPRAGLVEALLQYKRFKEAAGQLEALQTTHSLRVPRVAPAPMETPIEPGSAVIDANADELFSAFVRIMMDRIREANARTIVNEELSTEECIGRITARLSGRSRIRFTELLSRGVTRHEIVVHFISILELIRLRQVWAYQTDDFTDIYIEPRPPEQRASDYAAPWTQPGHAALAAPAKRKPVAAQVPARADEPDAERFFDPAAFGLSTAPARFLAGRATHAAGRVAGAARGVPAPFPAPAQRAASGKTERTPERKGFLAVPGVQAPMRARRPLPNAGAPMAGRMAPGTVAPNASSTGAGKNAVVSGALSTGVAATPATRPFLPVAPKALRTTRARSIAAFLSIAPKGRVSVPTSLRRSGFLAVPITAAMSCAPNALIVHTVPAIVAAPLKPVAPCIADLRPQGAWHTIVAAAPATRPFLPVVVPSLRVGGVRGQGGFLSIVPKGLSRAATPARRRGAGFLPVPVMGGLLCAPVGLVAFVSVTPSPVPVGDAVLPDAGTRRAQTISPARSVPCGASPSMQPSRHDAGSVSPAVKPFMPIAPARCTVRNARDARQAAFLPLVPHASRCAGRVCRAVGFLPVPSIQGAWAIPAECEGPNGRRSAVARDAAMLICERCIGRDHTWTRSVYAPLFEKLVAAPFVPAVTVLPIRKNSFAICRGAVPGAYRAGRRVPVVEMPEAECADRDVCEGEIIAIVWEPAEGMNPFWTRSVYADVLPCVMRGPLPRTGLAHRYLPVPRALPSTERLRGRGGCAAPVADAASVASAAERHSCIVAKDVPAGGDTHGGEKASCRSVCAGIHADGQGADGLPVRRVTLPTRPGAPVFRRAQCGPKQFRP